jgi:hypothetical protein
VVPASDNRFLKYTDIVILQLRAQKVDKGYRLGIFKAGAYRKGSRSSFGEKNRKDRRLDPVS